MKNAFKVLLVLSLIFSLLLSAAAEKREYDVNGDGRVDLLDAIKILKSVVSEANDTAMDVDGNGMVNVSDAVTVLLSIVNDGSAFTKDYSYIDIVNRLTDTKLLSMGNSGEESKLFSSYDQNSKLVNGKYVNWRANGDGSNVLGTTEDGGHLIADIEGAGYVSRIWSATAGPGHVKIYIDGAEEAVIDLAFADYFNRTKEPFTYSNLVYEDSARGKNNYVPITFNESCRIVAYGGFGNDGWGKYYHINYTLFPDGTTVEPMPTEFSAEQKAALEGVNSVMSAAGTHPGGYGDAAFETFTVSKDTPFVKTLSGRGAISGLLVRVDSLSSVYAQSQTAIERLKDLRIKIYWDGENVPSVNAPLGDFFANNYGFNSTRMLLLGMRDDRTFYNYFYMPYAEQAKIEIYTVGDESETVSLSVNVVKNDLRDADILYFGSQFTLGHYHEDALDADGNYDKTGSRSPDYHFLTVKGAGKFVGVTLHHNKTVDGKDPLSSPGSPWWGEGDEKFFVDGEAFPSWFGTGTEDFFGYAWCDPTWFNKPYHAQPYCEGSSNSVGNRVVSRILVGDAIPFDENFEGYIEKYYSDEYTQYSFTSYFYLAKDSAIEGVDYDDTATLDYYVPASHGEYLIEGEDLYINSYRTSSGEVISTSASHIDHQPMASYSPAWSGNAQILITGLGLGGEIDLLLPAPKDGKYMLLASFANATDFSTVQPYVNGIKVGEPIDTYGTIVAADYLYEIGEVTLAKGNSNILTLKNIERNAASTSNGYRIGIDFLLLVPADEYTSLADFDLSKYTDVVRLNTKRNVTEKNAYTFEGETDLIADAILSDGTPSAQTMTGWGDGWSGGKQLFMYNKTVTDATLTVFIFVEAGGTYSLDGAFTTGGDYGKYKTVLNGASIGTLDFYNSKVSLMNYDFGTVTLKAGYNKIVFTATGKNASSSGYCIGIDYIKATRINEENVYTFEGETDVLATATATKGAFSAQVMSGYSGGKQLWYRPGSAGAELTCTVNVAEEGTYKLNAALCTAKDYGTFDLYVNGTKAVSFDGYSPTLVRVLKGLCEVKLNAGTNTLKFVIVDKNTSSTNYMMGIDYLQFVKVK